MASSDDDAQSDVSNTETEYEVDCVVAERVDEDDGRPRYLVRWLGYPDVQNTWEPQEHFLNPETLDEWKTKKQRIAEGELSPFDIADWSAHVERWLEEEERKEQDRGLETARTDHDQERLERKGKLEHLASRMALTAARGQTTAEEGEEEECEDSITLIPEQPSVKRRRRDDYRERGSGFSPWASSPLTSPLKNAFSTIKKRPNTTPKRIASKSFSDLQARQPLPLQRSGSGTITSPKLTAKDLRDIKPVYKRSVVKGVGPAKATSILRSNVFNNWDKAPSTRKRTVGAKLYTHISYNRAAELKGRNEPAPKISSIQSFSASTGEVVAEPNTQTYKAGSLPTFRREESPLHNSNDRLFLTPERSPRPSSPPRPTASGSFVARAKGPSDNSSDCRQKQQNDHQHATCQVQSAGMQTEVVWGLQTRDVRCISATTIDQFVEVKGALVVEPSAFGAFRRGKDDSPITARSSFFVHGSRSEPWWRHFLRIKVHPIAVNVCIQQLCSASEYQRDHHKDGKGYFSYGYVPENKAWTSMFRVYVQKELVQKRQGGLFFCPYYTLLIYPIKCPEWAFLDSNFGADGPFDELHFVFRSPPDPVILESATKNATSNTDMAATKNMSKLDVPRLKTVTFAEPALEETRSDEGINIPEIEEASTDAGLSLEELFEKYYGRKWSGIVPPLPPSQITPSCCIYYPAEPEITRKEHSFLKEILSISQQFELYRSLEEGDWEKFIESAKEVGLVLLHSSIQIEKIPRLAERVLRNGNIRFAQIDVRHRDPTAPQSARRIFPSGGVLLLLDSVVLQKPEIVARLLRWFRNVKLKTMATSKWKFVVRPGFRDWVRKIIDNQKSFRTSAKLSPFRHILKELMFIMPESLWNPQDDRRTPIAGADVPIAGPSFLPEFDEDVGTQEANPFEVLKSNDSKLVQWFGSWTLEVVDQHRKFYIVHEDYGMDAALNLISGWTSSWQHISLATTERFIKWENVKRDEDVLEEKSRKQGGEAKRNQIGESSE